MDFSLSEDQQALKEMARRIFREHLSPESLAAVEDGEGWDRELWHRLAQTDFLGLSLPESVGGSALGLVETCLLLEQVGAAVAPVPVWSTLILGAHPIATFGSETQQQTWLPGVVTGEMVLTAALADGAPMEAVEANGVWTVSGVRGGVPMGTFAHCVVLPTARGVFLLDPKADGVTVEAQAGTNGMPMAQLTLNGASVEWLADASARESIEATAHIGLCAMTLGVAQKALHMTAGYTSEREQFGLPIATFQAVSQRMGDSYIDVETIRLCLWRAAWLRDQGESAIRETAVARMVSTDAGHRVVCAAQHLHGGMGFVCEYPLHRYFLWAKQFEFLLGGVSNTVAQLGDLMAEGA
jgi:alkylation response protein AidB-like acyl-CoA dehydrogenase